MSVPNREAICHIVRRVNLARGPGHGPGNVAGTSGRTQGSSSLVGQSFSTRGPLRGYVASVARVGTSSKGLCISTVFSYCSLTILNLTVSAGVGTALYRRALSGTCGTCPVLQNTVLRDSENARCADRLCHGTVGGCNVLRDVGDTNNEYRSGTEYRDV